MHVCGRGCQSLPPPACNKPRLSHVHDAIVQYLRYFTATEALHTRCAFRVCSIEGVQVMSKSQVNFVRTNCPTISLAAGQAPILVGQCPMSGRYRTACLYMQKYGLGQRFVQVPG